MKAESVTSSTQHQFPSDQKVEPSEDMSSFLSSSLVSMKKRKRLTIAEPSPHLDEEVFDINPRRRFKRRNSKCASMFYQMLSTTNLLELQREMGVEDEDEAESPWGTMSLLYPECPKSTIKILPPQIATPPTWHGRNPVGSLHAKNSTLSILAEALRLSSAHLDELSGNDDATLQNESE